MADFVYYCSRLPPYNAEESVAVESREKGSGKKGVKRPAPSDDSDSENGAVSVAKASKGKPTHSIQKDSKKKKKKKGRGKFVRKKITGEDEDLLKKSGSPEDVNALLQPSVVVSKGGESASESADDDSDDDDGLSLDTDFFPANQQLTGEEYLSEVFPGWQKAMKMAKLKPGSPLLLILCSSAIRAVQLNREIKSFLGKECKTAKLFAKHMKLEEQQKFLQKKVCHAAIGTPNRVQALLEAGTLKLDHLHAIVLDWNWRDIKLKRLVDIPDVKRDLSVMLKEYALDHIKSTPCRIAIF